MGLFLASDGTITIDPDGALTYFEVPIAGPLPETLNFIHSPRVLNFRGILVYSGSLQGRRPLCYDGVAHAHGGRALGREDTGWTLSRSWIR